MVLACSLESRAKEDFDMRRVGARIGPCDYWATPCTVLSYSCTSWSKKWPFRVWRKYTCLFQVHPRKAWLPLNVCIQMHLTIICMFVIFFLLLQTDLANLFVCSLSQQDLKTNTHSQKKVRIPIEASNISCYLTSVLLSMWKYKRRSSFHCLSQKWL